VALLYVRNISRAAQGWETQIAPLVYGAAYKSRATQAAELAHTSGANSVPFSSPVGLMRGEWVDLMVSAAKSS
jgi:hypothetical protein